VRKILFVVWIAVLLLCTPRARAQQLQRGEVFGGYSYAGAVSGGSFTSFPAGFAADVDVSVKKWLSVEGDIGYHHGSVPGLGVSLFEFVGGPRFTAHYGKTDIFAHGLIVGTRVSAGAYGVSAGITAFTVGVGAGVDVAIQHYFAIRVVQADVLPAEFQGGWTVPIKLSAGVVIRF